MLRWGCVCMLGVELYFVFFYTWKQKKISENGRRLNKN